MNIEKFIENKQREVLENDNFLKWNKDNKLIDEDGYPIITFHGSTNNDFSIIDLNYSKDSWWCGRGLYSTDSIFDVNANYATAEKKESQYSSEKEYTAGDLKNRIYETKENAESAFENEQDCVFWNYDEIEDWICEDTKIDLNVLKENPNVFNGCEFDKMLINEDNTIEVSDLIDSLSVNKYVKNNGLIKPLFVKMKNPAYYTTENDATKITIIDDQIQDFMDQYDYEHGQVMEMVEELAETLTEHCSDSKEELEEEIKHEIQGYVTTFCEDVGEELYDCLIDYVESNYGLEDEEVNNIVRTAFSNNDLGEYNEEDESMEFEHVVVFDLFEDDDVEEQQDLYKKIKQSVLDNTEDDWSYRAVEETFQNFEMKSMEQGSQSTTLYNLFKAFRHHENEPDLVNHFNEGIKEHFDGIVLDAIDANEQWRFNQIGYDTRHYIVFDKFNVKSALGNNGDYSLSDPNIAARRSREQKFYCNKETFFKLKDKINEYNNSYLSSIKIVGTGSNSVDNREDFYYNRKDKTVYLNLNKVKNTKELSKIITHEVVGHVGLEIVLGKNKNKFLDNVAKKYKKEDYKEVIKLYPEYDYDKKEGKRKLTEEKICYYAERKFKHDNYMNKVVNKIRKKFSDFKKILGINTVEDDIFQTLYKANQQLQQKRKKRKFF